MDRDFEWLWDNYKEGARTKFEEVCYSVYKMEYPKETVKRVRVTKGDGGVDVYVSHTNGGYTIVQCKFFRYEVGKSQKQQIRDSFRSAIKNHGDEITKWIICVPLQLSDKEHQWWLKWKKEREVEYNIEMQLDDSDDLMNLIKNHNLYEEYFNTVRVDKEFIKDLIENDEKKRIHDRLYPLISGDYDMLDVISKVEELIDLKAHRVFKENQLINFLNELMMIFAYNAQDGVITNPEINEAIYDMRVRIIEEYEKLNL
ncbi:restriction endonuclease [Bacillus mycoides]|uniref:restriction endonuclease n=1 Tax=Bacillus mycoides TaxID=1405 RepID=UPI003D23CD89